MDFNRDQLRRDIRDTQPAHRAAMAPFGELVARLFGDEGATTAERRAHVLPAIGRRRFLRIGGFTVASAAVLAACGTDDAADEAPETTTTTEAVTDADIVILRTASSLEHLAVETYTRAIDSGLLTTTAVVDAAKLFRDQHTDHAELLQGATANSGGEPFTEPNPAVLDQLRPAIEGAGDERAIVQLTHDLERILAATYQADTGQFGATRFNELAMSIAGVEARHAAVLARILGQTPPPAAFSSTERAVAAGTGV